MADKFFYNTMHVKITYAAVRKALRKEKLKFLKMSLVGKDKDIVVDAVNQGIDAHLEVCSMAERGDKYEHGERKIGDKIVQVTLECQVSAESLPVLLRRLLEPEFKSPDEGERLAEDMLTTIGFDEMGKYVGTKELGV